MKRAAFLAVASLLVYLGVFSLINGKFVLAVPVLGVLVALMVWGGRLASKADHDAVVARVKQYEKEAQWSGDHLVLKPRWFTRLCIAAMLTAGCFVCVVGAKAVGADPEKSLLWVLGFGVAAAAFGYSAWLTFAGFLCELAAGYSLKLDAAGFHLAGHPTVPWSAVYRARHFTMYGGGKFGKGRDIQFLDLHLNPGEIGTYWRGPFRAFLMGPWLVAIAMARGTGRIRLRGAFLSEPVPRLVTAICKIGSRHAGHPVVKWNGRESLENSRRLDELLRNAMEPIDHAPQKRAFDEAMDSFAKKSGAIDTTELDAAMRDLEQQLRAKSDAAKDHSQLSARVL